jgi:hypothetical protein
MYGQLDHNIPENRKAEVACSAAYVRKILMKK